jgi:hypothetical protein
MLTFVLGACLAVLLLACGALLSPLFQGHWEQRALELRARAVQDETWTVSKLHPLERTRPHAMRVHFACGPHGKRVPFVGYGALRRAVLHAETMNELYCSDREFP